MTTTTLINYETNYLREALGELKDYLLSKELFWQVSQSSLHGAAPFPQLTLGNLLLSRNRLEGLTKGGRLSQEQRKEFKSLTKQIDAIKAEWRSAWEKKAEREFHSRLTQWGRYLEEMGASPDLYDAYYATEVRVRVLLETLAGELPAAAATRLREDLAVQDRRLERLTAKGDFVWDSEQQRIFPAKEFPYLYRRPKGR